MESRPTVRSLLEWQAVARPRHPCFIAPETGCHLRFGELLEHAQGLAHFLAGQSLPPGAHVAWLLPNGLQAFLLFIGSMAAGYVATPLSLLAQPEQLAYVLEHSDCRLVFVAGEFAGRLNAALKSVEREIQVIVIDPDRPEFAGEARRQGWRTRRY